MATIVICPRCRFPYDDSSVDVVGARDVTCELCGWQGSSEDMILVPFGERVLDMKAFRQLMGALHRTIAPQIGALLINLGLVKPTKEPGNIEYMASLLSLYTRAGFETLVRGIADPERTVFEARDKLRIAGTEAVN